MVSTKEGIKRRLERREEISKHTIIMRSTRVIAFQYASMLGEELRRARLYFRGPLSAEDYARLRAITTTHGRIRIRTTRRNPVGR